MNKPAGTSGGGQRVYLVLALVMGATVACLAWTTWTADRMLRDFVPQVGATLHARLAVTEAHLWLEEIVSGDSGETPEQVYELLDGADAALAALLDGGEVGGVAVVAVADASLATDVRAARTTLAGFRQIARERMDSAGLGGVGSDLDSRFDGAFEDFVARSAAIDARVQRMIDDARGWFLRLQSGLMLSVALMFSWVWWLLRRKEKQQRLVYQQAQQDAYERLAASQGVLERQNRVRGALVDLERAVQGIESPRRVASILLNSLCDRTGAHVGSAWLYRPGAGLRRLAGYALPPGEAQRDVLAEGEGLAGEAARTGVVLNFDAPAGFLRVTSGTGNTAAARVEVRPVLHEGVAVAVFEFAFMHAPDEEALELIAAALDASAMRFYLFVRDGREFAAQPA